VSDPPLWSRSVALCVASVALLDERLPAPEASVLRWHLSSRRSTACELARPKPEAKAHSRGLRCSTGIEP